MHIFGALLGGGSFRLRPPLSTASTCTGHSFLRRQAAAPGTEDAECTSLLHQPGAGLPFRQQLLGEAQRLGSLGQRQLLD